MTAPPDAQIPGLPARRIAADILDGVLRQAPAARRAARGAAAHHACALCRARPRAGARHIVATALRRLGTLRHLLARLLERGLPADAPRVESALLIGAAQILFLDVPDHAAVDLSVRLAQADRTPRAMPAWSMPCCGGSRAKARARSPQLDTARARHAGMADASAGRAATARRPRAPSPRRTRASRRSISR